MSQFLTPLKSKIQHRPAFGEAQVPNQIKVHEEAAQALQSLLHVAVPEIMF
jgi:hypothetical protein